MLGVCLGHQAIAAGLGANVIRATRPVHGRHSLVRHDGSRIFHGVESPFQACRYHSLVVDEATLPTELVAAAWTEEDQVLMGLRHQTLPIFGVQFHPESVLTPAGYQLLANFLHAAGVEVPQHIPDLYSERPPEPPQQDSAEPPPIYY